MYQVKDKNELRRIILDRKIPLETIDTSLITDMNKLFHNVNKINGSISKGLLKIPCQSDKIISRIDNGRENKL